MILDRVIQEYLANVDNLAKLEPKNLPFEVLQGFAKMDEAELFKTCSQFFVLKNNIPSENNLINLTQDEVIFGATEFAKAILNRIKNSL